MVTIASCRKGDITQCLPKIPPDFVSASNQLPSLAIRFSTWTGVGKRKPQRLERVETNQSLWIDTPAKFFPASLPLKNGGKGRRSDFLLGQRVTFQGLLLLNFGRIYTTRFYQVLPDASCRNVDDTTYTWYPKASHFLMVVSVGWSQIFT